VAERTFGLVSTMAFYLEIAKRAAQSLLDAMGTTALAWTIEFLVLPILVFLFMVARLGLTQMRQHWKENLKDIAVVTAGVWVLLYCYQLFYKVPHEISQAAQNERPRIVGFTISPPIDWVRKGELRPADPPQLRPQQQAFLQSIHAETFLTDRQGHPDPYAEIIYINPGSSPASTVRVEMTSSCEPVVPAQDKKLEMIFSESITHPTYRKEVPTVGIGGVPFRVEIPLRCIYNTGAINSPDAYLHSMVWAYVVGRISFHDIAGHHTAETCMVLVPPEMSNKLAPLFPNRRTNPTNEEIVRATYNRWRTCSVHNGPGPDIKE